MRPSEIARVSKRPIDGKSCNGRVAGIQPTDAQTATTPAQSLQPASPPGRGNAIDEKRHDIWLSGRPRLAESARAEGHVRIEKNGKGGNLR